MKQPYHAEAQMSLLETDLSALLEHTMDAAYTVTAGAEDRGRAVLRRRRKTVALARAASAGPAVQAPGYFFQGASGNDKPDSRNMRSLASTPLGNPVSTYPNMP